MIAIMRARVMRSLGEVGIIEKPVPRAGPNDAILRTTAALICTSDIHTVAGAIGQRKNLTLRREAVGVFHVNKAIASLAPIPNDRTDQQAAYCCHMLSTGFVAAEFGTVPLGVSVAVFGEGPIGMMATVGARLLSAGFVIGVDANRSRRRARVAPGGRRRRRRGSASRRGPKDRHEHPRQIARSPLASDRRELWCRCRCRGRTDA